MLKSILNSAGVQLLNKNEQQAILGGARYHCTCNGSVGEWYGTYNSAQSVVNAIQTWCASGQGSCDSIAVE